jgi:hypothetical protein
MLGQPLRGVRIMHDMCATTISQEVAQSIIANLLKGDPIERIQRWGVICRRGTRSRDCT